MDVICYAGGRGEYPENTLEAIAHCQEVNTNWWVEVDLQMTKDGHIILFHDDNFKRIVDLNMHVYDVPLHFIKELNVGYNFQSTDGYSFRNSALKIPTLKEMFKQFPTTKFVLDVHSNKPVIVDRIIGIVEHAVAERNVIVVSKYDHIINEFKDRRANWVYGAPTKEAKRIVMSSFFHLDFLFPLKSQVLMLPRAYNGHIVLSKQIIGHVKKRKRKLWVWLHEGKEVITVNTKNQYLKLMNLGVDGVFTENPKKLYCDINAAHDPA